MEIEQTDLETTGNSPAPTTLTADQAGQVAGGILTIGVLGGGCRTCTSGLPPEFAALAAAVNPASAI